MNGNLLLVAHYNSPTINIKIIYNVIKLNV